MTTTPQDAQTAVKRVLAEVGKEDEAAYRVIFEAVKVCIAAGMERRQAARFLGVSPRRIDRHGQYFRTLMATRNLFRGAFSGRPTAVEADQVDAIVRRAWKR